ncbi:unnamed protein product [Protopolystoma xenopodis]|uniref:Uncharacterized protein n=1 Tax=Protopolystoma xenopodis TaxID=117903 RepID=A0A3S5A0E8_9PLAT|nr:unnamed protein product [Protopolystoma xenopodis]
MNRMFRLSRKLASIHRPPHPHSVTLISPRLRHNSAKCQWTCVPNANLTDKPANLQANVPGQMLTELPWQRMDGGSEPIEDGRR